MSLQFKETNCVDRYLMLTETERNGQQIYEQIKTHLGAAIKCP